MTAGPSWQLRIANGVVRRVVRRESWGNEEALVRRARRLMGAPKPWAKLIMAGLRVEAVEQEGIRGEWLTPSDPVPGVILYIHGGGYVACTSRTHRPITAALARLTRRKVFSVDYRRAPENRFPAALEDVIAAYKWISDSTQSPIAIGGDSAGGGLALALLVAARDLGLRMPCCTVLISPWTDLTGSGDSGRTNATRCAMFAPPNLYEFRSVYLGDSPASDTRASPLFADLSRLPPIFIQVGDTELLLDDATRVHAKVRASGGDSTLQIWPHVFHGWHMLVGIAPEARDALKRCGEFISGHMQRTRELTSVAGVSTSTASNMQADQTTPSIA